MLNEKFIKELKTLESEMSTNSTKIKILSEELRAVENNEKPKAVKEAPK